MAGLPDLLEDRGPTVGIGAFETLRQVRQGARVLGLGAMKLSDTRRTKHFLAKVAGILLRAPSNCGAGRCSRRGGIPAVEGLQF
jgi:hypothetical protein